MSKNKTTFSIQKKLLIAFATLGVVITGTTITAGYVTSKHALEANITQQLTQVGNNKRENVKTFLDNLVGETAIRGGDRSTLGSLNDLIKGRDSLLAELAAAGIKPAEIASSALVENKAYYENILLANIKKVRKGDVGAIGDYLVTEPEAVLLQNIYTVKNPAGVGAKNKGDTAAEIAANAALAPELRAAFAKSTYAAAHDTAHETFTEECNAHGFYDAFLVDAEGRVVYSTFKELDFQANLKSGPDKGTGLAKAWSMAMNDLKPGTAAIVDYAPYAKSYDAPAAFLAAPIVDAQGKKVGAVIYQVPIDKINEIMTSGGRFKEQGLGETGETYLVGPDGILRSDSRFVNGNTEHNVEGKQYRTIVSSDGKTLTRTSIGVEKRDTESIRSVLAGKTGTAVYIDAHNEYVLGTYTPLTIGGLNYGLVTEIDEPEAFKPVYDQAKLLGAIGGSLLLVALFAAYALARALAKPVTDLTASVEKIAAGDLTARAEITTHDEIGQLAEAFNGMVGYMVEASGKKAVEAESKKLQDGITSLLMTVADASDGDLTVRAKVTEGSLGNLADALNLLFENLGQLIADVQKTANQVAEQAANIEASSEQLTQGAVRQAGEILNTTSAVQEMAANIESVSANANSAAHASTQAQNHAEDGTKTIVEVIHGMERIRDAVQASAKKIKQLGESSMEIGTIVSTIRDISAQTDMLALNAAIEAARAGEHGRGFSVVAEEVRKLAERTSQATREIESRIRGIQAETNESVSAMESQTTHVEHQSTIVQKSGDALKRIRESSLQSNELINEINLAAKQQVRGATGVVQAMEIVSGISEQAKKGAEQNRKTTEELVGISKRMNKLTAQFKV